MELRELRYFLAVAQEQSITKAANYLYISQPSLSKQMQNLEKEVGRPLFVRGSRKIALTETGVLLKKRAEEMIALYEKTEAEISAPPEDVAGEVLIGGGESCAVRTVAQAACAVQREYPSVRFRLFSGDADEMMERLDKGLIDFCIVVDLERLPDYSKYSALRLPYADTWGVLMRRDSALAAKERITADDLRGVPILTSLQSLRKGSRLLEWFGGDVKGLNICGKFNLIYNASLLARRKVGYVISLKGIVETPAEGELAFLPLEPALTADIYLAWKRYQTFSPAAEVFLNKIQSLWGR